MLDRATFCLKAFISALDGHENLRLVNSNLQVMVDDAKDIVKDVAASGMNKTLSQGNLKT